MRWFKNIYRKIQKKLRIVNSSDFRYILEEDVNLKIKNLEEKIKDNEVEISELKEYNYKRINEIKNDNYRVERDLFLCFQNLEYKLYEFNKYANQILYKNKLEFNRIKGNVKHNFEPKVSIIMPAYNASKYIKEAIDSALNQTYKNIEIIVVNDGSNDNGKTKRIVESYGDKIRYFEKKNGGVSSALNYGIRYMIGDFFTWLSHDDRYYSNYIEEHVNYLRNTNEKNIVTFSNFDIIDENSNLLLNETISANLYCFDYKINQQKPEYSLLQGEINGGSVMIPKSAFYECGLFDESLRVAQERDMWFRLMKKYKFCNIPFETSSIRFHKEQVTNTNDKVISETNQKRLEIINNMEDATKEKLEHNVKNFYKVMSNYYKRNGLSVLKEKMDEYEKRDVV